MAHIRRYLEEKHKGASQDDIEARCNAISDLNNMTFDLSHDAKGEKLSILFRGMTHMNEPLLLSSTATMVKCKKILDESINNRCRKLKVAKGAIRCPECGSYRTTHVVKQLRAGDEGGTKLLMCTDCRYQFSL